MAAALLPFVVFLLSLLQSSGAQTIIGLSPYFDHPDPPVNPSPDPTKQSVYLWPSLPPRGRSDVPVRPTVKDKLTNTGQQGQRSPRPTPQSSPSFISALSMHNLSSGPLITRPPSTRARTDTAHLTNRWHLAKVDPTLKGLTAPQPTLFLSAPSENPEEEALRDATDDVLQDLGSGDVPTQDENPAVGDGMAQHRPPPLTTVSMAVNQSAKPHLFLLTPVNKISTSPSAEVRATAPPVAAQTQPPAVILSDDPMIKSPSTIRGTPERDSSAVHRPTTTTTVSVAGRAVAAKSGPYSEPTQQSTTEFITAAPEGGRTTPKMTNQPKKTAQLGKNPLSTKGETSGTGTSSFTVAGVVPVSQTRLSSTHQTAVLVQRDRSINLGQPRQASQATSNPGPSVSTSPSTNATFLYWGDLSRTLAFAWELHVYGSASLFLLLFVGAALGLTLSPGANRPQRGALALANAFLFVAGGLRAALLLIDPYGTRGFLPRPAIMALYNLPLHLLVWAQASLVLLALRVTGISVLPSPLESPPLLAVLAVLQGTLLLAADLFSLALSPVVPVTIQVLSICWGLALCLGFLCYVFPRIRCPPAHHLGDPEEARRKGWTGRRRISVILGRVLAVGAVLGVLCCGLHVYATLWLYGLHHPHFNWGWWLSHFWARLLELTWGLSLLVTGLWVFWRQQAYRVREESRQDSRAAGELPSPDQSVGSTQRHSCWSKIVQSLRGKPCRKPENNGLGGGAGGPGEVPNNCASQERHGADISKSLIRNQSHDQAMAQPRCKDSNQVRSPRGHSVERGISDGSTGSLLRLQTLGQPPQRSVSGSLDQDRDVSLSLYEFDLRPPSPIDLTRSIDEALHREHLLGGGSLFHPLNQSLHSPSLGSEPSPGPWHRRNSDPQLLSESSDAPTESSMPLGGSILSSVPSRQVTAPPTPSHQGHRWTGNMLGSVPSSVSCPVSLHPSRASTGHLGDDGADDTRPFITPDSERVRGRARKPVGSRSYLEVNRHDDSASFSSEIIDL